MYICSCSGGKDSIATVILAHEHNEPLDLIVFAEVMFDDNISGEFPEHIDFIKNKAFPLFESWGYKTVIVRSKKTYMDCFNHVASRGKRIGQVLGFPMAGKCIINSRCKVKAIHDYLRSIPDCKQYVGIAYDEPQRLERLSDDKISLLAKYKYIELMSRNKCIEYDLLSPVYDYTNRGGCWFCPNARKAELKHLREHHSDLWNTLLSLELRSDLIGHKWNILTDTSIHDFERMFAFDDLQITFDM